MAARLGTVSVDHRDLGRSWLVVQRLSVSDDGRISGGGGVQAAVTGPASWDLGPLADRWEPPLADQLKDGAGLVFVAGTVLGATDGGGLLLASDAGPVEVVAPSDHRVLGHAHNLRLLAAAGDRWLRVVGRPALERPRTLVGIAASFGPDEDAAFPTDWNGVVNLGLDRLAAAHLPAGGPTPILGLPSVPSPDPVHPLDRRLQRLALGGRPTLAGTATPAVIVDVGRLRRAQLSAGASLLEQLHAAVLTSERGATGEALVPAADSVARAWLAAAVYAEAARRSVTQAVWAG